MVGSLCLHVGRHRVPDTRLCEGLRRRVGGIERLPPEPGLHRRIHWGQYRDRPARVHFQDGIVGPIQDVVRIDVWARSAQCEGSSGIHGQEIQEGRYKMVGCYVFARVERRVCRRRRCRGNLSIITPVINHNIFCLYYIMIE